MKRHLVRLVVTMLALCAGTAFASIPGTSEHVLRTEPMIVGTVGAVGDRKLIVDTDQNEQVTLMMDSRTMLPVDLAPGTLFSGDEQRSRMATNYEETLPQTAGDQSLIGLLGLIALGASGVLVQLRRPRH